MSYHNQLTVRRHRKALAEMIVDTMRNEDLSLLQAYVKVAALATSDEVIALAKEKVEEFNGKAN